MLKNTLLLSKVIENGILFKTNVPVTFNFLRNTQRAFRHPDPARFGQNLEPSGRYMSHDTNPQGTRLYLPDLQQGVITFKHPFVLENITPSSYPSGWKYRLSKYFNNKTGKSLTKAIISKGYDGIVTTDGNHTSEIVDLKL